MPLLLRPAMRLVSIDSILGFRGFEEREQIKLGGAKTGVVPDSFLYILRTFTYIFPV